MAILSLQYADITVAKDYINAVVKACLRQQYEIDKVKVLIYGLRKKGFSIEIDSDYLEEESGPVSCVCVCVCVYVCVCVCGVCVCVNVCVSV